MSAAVKGLQALNSICLNLIIPGRRIYCVSGRLKLLIRMSIFLSEEYGVSWPLAVGGRWKEGFRQGQPHPTGGKRSSPPGF